MLTFLGYQNFAQIPPKSKEIKPIKSEAKCSKLFQIKTAQNWTKILQYHIQYVKIKVLLKYV